MVDENNLGGLKSPVDERDYIHEDIMQGSALPPTPPVSLNDYSELPVYYQGQQPSCGGHAGAWLQNLLAHVNVKLSPRFVYAMCLKISGLPVGSGVYGRDIMKVLQTYGVCEDSYFPNDVSLSMQEYADFTKIPQAAFINAKQYRIGSYAAVKNLSLQGLKDAIWASIGILILKSPWTPTSNSGHFFDGDGFDTQRVRYQNSFGVAWRDHGQGYLLQEDMSTIIEAWSVIEPSVVAPVIPQPVPVLPPNPTVAQESSWLDAVVAWLKQTFPSFFN